MLNVLLVLFVCAVFIYLNECQQGGGGVWFDGDLAAFFFLH